MKTLSLIPLPLDSQGGSSGVDMSERRDGGRERESEREKSPGWM